MSAVAIALVRYTRLVLVASMSMLAVGANLPQDIALDNKSGFQSPDGHPSRYPSPVPVKTVY